MPATDQGFEERLIAQLHKDQPRWYLDWATGSELLQYSEECVRTTADASSYCDAGLRHTQLLEAGQRLQRRVAARLFYRILNASISANIVKEA